MAGFSLSAPSPSPSLNLIEVVRKLQSVGFCSDLFTFNLSSQKLSSAFNRILSIFTKEILLKPEIRPVPPMLGNGQAVDLFRLYSAVHERGGSEPVTAAKAWPAVSEQIGFDSGAGPSLKLLYVKYLGAFERWMGKVIAKKENLVKVVPTFGELSVFQEVAEAKKEEEDTKVISPKKNHFLTLVRDGVRRLEVDDGENGGKAKGDVVVLVEVNVENGWSGSGSGSGLFNKRKRDLLVGMLDWVLRIAKNPGDFSIGKCLDSARGKDKEHRAVGEFYSQVLLARRAMFVKKAWRMDASTQKGQKMHPSIYEVHVDASVRHSRRLHSTNNGSNSGSSEASMILESAAGEEANGHKRRHRNSSPLSDIMSHLLPHDQKMQRVPTGLSFQAKVPLWTGKPSSSSYSSDDLRWLGEPIWPPENQINSSPKQDIIDNGRQDNCTCAFSGSVDCVRFHVAERRFQLKRELGSAFSNWRFDHMGEEVAVSWTEEEERKFKEIVYRNSPSVGKKLWKELQSSFALKGRKNLVSYYFNVFLLARRSYQNRVTPNSIDSEDEETEFGFLSKPFGHDAVKVEDLAFNFCALNAQCVDLDV